MTTPAPAADPNAPPAQPPAPAPPAAAPPANPPEVPPAAAPAEKPPGEPPAAEPGTPKEGEVPAEYADFTVPEGIQVDADLLTNFKPVAKELGLSQERAQKLVDFYANTVVAQITKRNADLYAQTIADWGKTAEGDKEYGGEKFKENVTVAQKAMTAFGTPELKEALEKTGMGNHPELIRFFWRIGNAISEDKFVLGGSAGAGPMKIEDRLYPSMKST